MSCFHWIVIFDTSMFSCLSQCGRLSTFWGDSVPSYFKFSCLSVVWFYLIYNSITRFPVYSVTSVEIVIKYSVSLLNSVLVKLTFFARLERFPCVLIFHFWNFYAFHDWFFIKACFFLNIVKLFLLTEACSGSVKHE